MAEKNIIEIKNKKAEYLYFLMDSFTAGLVLTGTEIKSIREGRANLTDAYCAFIGNELFVKQMHISEYRFGSWLNHAAKRDRKLLLNKKELRKLQNKIKERGYTIVPTLAMQNSISALHEARNSSTNAKQSRRRIIAAIWKGNCDESIQIRRCISQ